MRTGSSPIPGPPRSGGSWMTSSCPTARCSPSGSAPSPPTSSSPPATTRRRAAGCSRPTSRSWPSTSATGNLAWRWTPPAGPGRFAEFLARRGHQVIGIDSSPDMLAHARRRVPDGEFHVAALDQLPLPDGSVDVIICALALVHVPRLQPVLAEFARVLRPGGDLVISDVHHKVVTRGSVIKARGPGGEPRIAATYRHGLGDYLRAALSLGLQVRRCEELSHAALDAVADLHRNATGHITALLTALGALPARDTHMACLERDIAAILDGAADQDMRRLLHRYATWGLLRHARAKARQAPLTSGLRHGPAARLKTAVHFTSWLASHGLDLAACRQPDLDTYLLTCPARRDEVRHFLAWGRRYRDRALTVAQAPRPDTTVPLAQDQRWALARSLLHDNGHDPSDRVAGLLVLLFGQRPGRI